MRGGVNGGRSGGPVGREGGRKGELVIVGCEGERVVWCEGERVVWRMESVCVAGDELLLWQRRCVWTRGEECMWDWRGMWRERIGVGGRSGYSYLVYLMCLL